MRRRVLRVIALLAVAVAFVAVVWAAFPQRESASRQPVVNPTQIPAQTPALSPELLDPNNPTQAEAVKLAASSSRTSLTMRRPSAFAA